MKNSAESPDFLFTMAEVRLAREKHLKELRALSNRLLFENKTIKDTHSAKWQYAVIENNITQLKETIRIARENLRPEELDSYSSSIVEQQHHLYEQNKSFELLAFSYVFPTQLQSDIINTLKYSTGYSINYDLHWLDVGTVGEHMDVAMGTQPPDVLDKYCPEKLSSIQSKVLPLLKNRRGYETTFELLEYLVNSFNKMPYLAVSILLITIVESLVRELCRFVYINQNPSKSIEESIKYVQNFQSLEKLISQGIWHRDLTISLGEAYFLAAHIEDPELKIIRQLADQNKTAQRDLLRLSRETQLKLEKHVTEKGDDKQIDLSDKLEQMRKSINLITDIKTRNVSINLPIKLEFLMRRYKDDRNQIIHGTYENFNKGWKCLVYLSAVVKVANLIVEYDKRYLTQSIV